MELDALLHSLSLEPQGDDRYRGANTETGGGVIFGGQLLAQSVVAAASAEPEKTVKTVQTIFARSGSPEHPVDIAVDRMHSGRAVASCTVTLSQRERLIARSQVLLSADEPDLVRHADLAPDVPGPGDSRPRRQGSTWEVRIAGDADFDDPEQIGPPELHVWTRFVGAPRDPVISQALLAFATDGFLIGTAMRPHAGIGQSQAHRTLSTAVLSHTLTFHEPVDASGWMLLSHRSTAAGRGRVYGRADVFAESGTLVASFVQDGMIRAMATDRRSTL